MDKSRSAWLDDNIEPQRYYEWILWKLRQEQKMEDDPTDDISVSVHAWTEASTKGISMSREDILKHEIATMQKCLNSAYKRIVELNDELKNLKDKRLNYPME